MLRCYMDINIDKNDKCAYCCIHCKEKDTCEYRCNGVNIWKENEKEIAKNCDKCVDEL